MRHIACDAAAAMINSTLRNALLLALTIPCFFSSAFAQASGSPYRKEYQSERNGPHGDCPVDWREVSSGIRYRSITCLGDADDLDLHVFRIDLRKANMDAAWVPGGGAAQDVARDEKAVLAMNANFFTQSRQPLGLLVRSGKQLQAPRKSSWQSIFTISDEGKPRVVLPADWSEYRHHALMAVQAGPRLVIKGHTNRVHQSYSAARCGVCVQSDGSLMLFATPQSRKFDMYEIGRIARRAEIDGGLECRDAMLFDGGHSTQVYAETDRRPIRIDGDPVPVFLFVTPR